GWHKWVFRVAHPRGRLAPAQYHTTEALPCTTPVGGIQDMPWSHWRVGHGYAGAWRPRFARNDVRGLDVTSGAGPRANNVTQRRTLRRPGSLHGPAPRACVRDPCAAGAVDAGLRRHEVAALPRHLRRS